MPRELPVISAYFPLGDIRTSSGRAGERFTAAKGAPSLAAGSWLVQDQARRPRPPPAPRRLTGQRRVATPDLVRRAARLDAQRSGLEDPEPLPVLRPLELDGRTELGLRLEHEARERGGLSVGQTRHLDPLGFHGAPARAITRRDDQMLLASRLHRLDRGVAPHEVAIGHDLALGDR